MFESRGRAAIFIVISILFALTAAFLFLSHVRKTEQALGQNVSIVVASKDIPPLTPITKDMLTTSELPKKYVFNSFFQDYKNVVGKVLTTPVLKGEVITTGMITNNGQFPEDVRVVRLRVPTAVFDEEIVSGDRIDIVASYQEGGKPLTKILFSNIKVVNVFKGKEDQVSSVSVALKTDQIEKVVWMHNFGKEMRILKQNINVTKEVYNNGSKGSIN